MAGLVKELLLDYALNKLSLDMRSDLTLAIQSVYSSGVFSQRDIRYLDLYLQGYTSQEIAHRYNTTTNTIDAVLERIFTAIETTSGYTDDILTKKVELNRAYRRSGISELTHFLTVHGKRFMTHGVEA